MCNSFQTLQEVPGRDTFLAIVCFDSVRHVQCPVRRSSMNRKSLTHVELKAPLPDRVHLNLSSILSPIAQSASESISSARTSQCLRTSAPFRRSFSVPLDSPQTRKQGLERVTHTASPSGYTVCGVDESFSSLTLPSPTTLVRSFSWDRI